MNKKLVWGLAAILAILVVCYKLDIFTSPVSSPVVIYTDGSAEYTLTAENFADNSDGNFQEWILRFNNLFECIAFGDGNNCSKHTPLKVAPRFENESIGSPLILSVNFPQMSFLNLADDIYGPDTIQIRINSNHQKYQNIDSTTKIETGYLTSYKDRYEARCVKQEELAEGLFRLIEPTVDEKSQLVNKYPWSKEFRCSSKSASDVAVVDGSKSAVLTVGNSPKREYYALFGDEQNPVAYGSCAPKKQSFVGNCTMTIWLPQQRTAIVSYSFALLTKTPQIYNSLTVFLKERTLNH